MSIWRYVAVALAVAVGVMALPDAARAQSAIAGVVKDTSGAVLPGVTVEAASPALIERTRAVVTDNEGQYKIIDLRPGTYKVTFSLEGFNTVARDGIELPANFTASVSVELRVGALSETITVSGETPIVDVQSALVQNVIGKALLETIPTGRNFQGIAITAPAVQSSAPDVGGSRGMYFTSLTVYGSMIAEQAIQVDGISATSGERDGTVAGMYRDYADNEEVVFQTTAIPAEVSQGGVRINMIGREGGNTFKGSFFGARSPGSLQADNFTDALKARGMRTPSKTDRIYDVNGGIGGPISRDRLWFFSSARVFSVNLLPADAYNPDGSRAVDDGIQNNIGGRLTYQANAKNKISVYLGDQPTRRLGHRELGSGTAPSGTYIQDIYKSYNFIVKWNSTLSDRLLVEAGFARNFYGWTASPQPGFENSTPKQDLILGTSWDGWRTPWDHANGARNVVGSVTYVTGSHAFKTGVQYRRTEVPGTQWLPSDLVQQYRSGVPSSVVVYNTPFSSRVLLSPDLGLYVQDSWTINRLTLSPGLRYEWFHPVIPAQDAPAGRFVPARHFNAVPLPDFKDVTPRLGVAFDLFGNHKTAIKGSVSKYMQGDSVNFALLYNPMAQTTDQRTWTDANRDNIAQDGEIGPSNNANFGLAAGRSSPDPNIKRVYHMEYSASIQHELLPRVSLTASYFHRSYHNLKASKNTLVGPSDYTPISIANPMGGDPIEIYNLNPAKRSAVNIVDSTSPQTHRLYNGVELTFAARFKQGASLLGGVNIGKIAQVSCDVSDPNLLRFCDQRPYMPFLTQFKLSGNYPLPYGFQFSGVFQGLPGMYNVTATGGGIIEAGVVASYLVNRTLVPTLTQTQIAVPLNPPGSQYLDRQNQLDLRIGRRFRAGRATIDPSLDIFNTLNASTVTGVNMTWGSAYLRPLMILQGRLFRFSMQVNF